ncbi:MAG: phosphate ABC transporter substrate-binding protein PstS [Calothrix sp. MO_167.B42]|nr:phosphate ABC transporter substrate-binding protein PstS [Calothrix sp. MO_167.B42]
MVFSSILNRTFTASAITTAVVFAPLLTSVAQAETLTGAGASFPAPLYQRYAQQMRKAGLTMNYQACGSSCGIRQTIQGTVDFGGSDAAMTDTEMSKVNRGVILVPTAGGAVSVVYNLPGVNNLKLSRQVLPGIFSGQITKWNDPKIKKDNPGVNLPNSTIRSVVRADGSGTTFIFTNHLSNINGYFKGRIGTSKKPKWTRATLRSKGNSGVAATVKQTPGAIGYVTQAYAKENNLTTAMVQNSSGQFVAPTLQAANDALSSVKFPPNNRVFVGDSSKGYPIVGLTWMMVYKKYPTPAKAQAVRDMVKWVLTEGQSYNAQLNYTRIPSSVANQVIQTVNNNVK